jgi:hypothetical protein
MPVFNVLGLLSHATPRLPAYEPIRYMSIHVNSFYCPFLSIRTGDDVEGIAPRQREALAISPAGQAPIVSAHRQPDPLWSVAWPLSICAYRWSSTVVD